MAESPGAEALSIPLPQPADTQTLGRRLAGIVRPGDLIALTGDLGAGKTALARALIASLRDSSGGDASGEEVPSPTFTLLQTYDRLSAEGAPLQVWHFDLYRLGDPDEVDELGWEEALAGGLVLVEWPDRLGARLPAPRLDVTLVYGQDDAAEPGRVAVLQGGAGWADRLDRLAQPETPGQTGGGGRSQTTTTGEAGGRAGMSARESEIAAFLSEAGWPTAERTMLAGDASFRRYERLHHTDGSQAVLRDAPPPQEDVQPFRNVARLLQALGLSAPTVLSCDAARGLLLLEDFGDQTFGRLLAEGAQQEPLYRLATDTLIDLQRAWAARGGGGRDGMGADLPVYDDALLIDREANLLLDWYMPAVGLEPDEGQRQAYRQAWQEALARVHAHPQTLVLRDFFPDNLMLLEARDGTAACGLLDFQDAVIGSPLYDLASLLQDARRDVPPEIEEQMLQRYLAAFPELDAQDARVAYTVIAAQRHAKVIGIFTRLARRDGKPGYLAHIPRLWRMLNRALSAPALEPVHAWLDVNLPRTQRVIPPETAE